MRRGIILWNSLEELLQSIHQTDILRSLVEDLGQGHRVTFESELRGELRRFLQQLGAGVIRQNSGRR
ncbi:MAG: hypothetical protein DMG76_21155 [Acidobacteria bacterium]|nr:MAG: hypothetical protein DMG76_21155 [Acidobacteriota bacterium]